MSPGGSPSRFSSLKIPAPFNRENISELDLETGFAWLHPPPPSLPKPATDSLPAEKPFLRPFLACGGLRFPVSARRHRLQAPFGVPVSGGKNPVPNSKGASEVIGLRQRNPGQRRDRPDYEEGWIDRSLGAQAPTIHRPSGTPAILGGLHHQYTRT